MIRLIGWCLGLDQASSCQLLNFCLLSSDLCLRGTGFGVRCFGFRVLGYGVWEKNCLDGKDEVLKNKVCGFRRTAIDSKIPQIKKQVDSETGNGAGFEA